MATLTLSNTLIATPLALPKIFAVFDSWGRASTDLIGIGYGALTSESPVLPVGGGFVQANPVFAGISGDWAFTGNITGTFDSQGGIAGYRTKMSGAVASNENGELKLVGSYTESYIAKTGLLTSQQRYSSTSYRDANGSGWAWKGTYQQSYTKNLVTDTLLSQNISTTFTALTVSDSEGASLSLTGKVSNSIANPGWSGAFTGMTLTLGKTKLSATGLKLTYDDVNALKTESVESLLPSFLSGSDMIKVSVTDPMKGEIHGYTGNDKITGSAGNEVLAGDEGNDVLTGGAGNDSLVGGVGDDSLIGGLGNDTLDGGAGKNLLTGGAGADTFVLSDKFINKDQLVATPITTVKDFKTLEGDVLNTNFVYEAYLSLELAAEEQSEATIVYELSKGKFWYDPDGAVGENYDPVCFAIVVGFIPEVA